MKQPKTYDLCECYSTTGHKEHKSTLITNKSYKLCKGEKKKLDLSKYPKGTYFVIAKNGEDPLKRELKDGKAQMVEKSASSYGYLPDHPGIDCIVAQENLKLHYEK
jgi:hypothetical protein